MKQMNNLPSDINIRPLSYIITIPTPTAINESIVKIKKKFNLFHDQKITHQQGIISLNTAHITLKRRFYLQQESTEDDIIKTLRKITFDPIYITASTLSIYQTEEQGNVLVVLVDNNDELKRLHKSVLTSLLPFITRDDVFSGENYTPHISVLYKLSDNKIHEGISISEKEILPLSFTIDSFQLLKNIKGVMKEREIIYTHFVKEH